MICEMCGQDVPRLKKTVIEGSTLDVCAKCERFGQDYEQLKDKEGVIGRDTIAERLERREKRLKGKDVFEKGEMELALDFSKRIKNARTRMGLNQGELGKKINETDFLTSIFQKTRRKLREESANSVKKTCGSGSRIVLEWDVHMSRSTFFTLSTSLP